MAWGGTNEADLFAGTALSPADLGEPREVVHVPPAAGHDVTPGGESRHAVLHVGEEAFPALFAIVDDVEACGDLAGDDVPDGVIGGRP